MTTPAEGLPRHTTPTWEVELLISGVAVFAMLQLPGLLDDALFSLRPRLDPAWLKPLQMMYLYFKSAAVLLGATFVLYLLLRAHWIALVGMNSVYPDGVRHDGLRMGPVRSGVERASGASIPHRIESADNRATTVFAVGVVLATIMLVISILVAVLFIAAVAILAFSGIEPDTSTVFLLCAMAIAVPFALANMFDRRIGPRLEPGGRAHRALSRVFRFYRLVGFGRTDNVMSLVASHHGERRMVLTTFLVFMPVMMGVLFSMDASGDPERFGGYALFPQPAATSGRSVDAAHYDRLRDTARDPALPYIQDPVVIGPYLRLVVPFQPGNDDLALRRACPEAIAAGDEATAVAALDCLQRLHPASLDGKPLAALQYDAGSDPRTNRPALVAMVDVRGFARGRHELRVARTPANGKDAGTYVIPFWR